MVESPITIITESPILLEEEQATSNCNQIKEGTIEEEVVARQVIQIFVNNHSYCRPLDSDKPLESDSDKPLESDSDSDKIQKCFNNDDTSSTSSLTNCEKFAGKDEVDNATFKQLKMHCFTKRTFVIALIIVCFVLSKDISFPENEEESTEVYEL